MNAQPPVLQTAQQIFGISELKPVQAEVINWVLAKHDVLAILPTGMGKSLCYQIPAVQLGGLTIVVSPLISLIQDQVDKLSKLGLAATAIHSHLPMSAQLSRTQQILQGKFAFCYVSPERLTAPAFRPILQHCQINLIAIDEAHCVSVWGGDFRPSYRQVGQVIASLSVRPRVLAVTATATAQIVRDILLFCGLKQPRLTVLPATRANLQIQVRLCPRQTTRNLLILQWIILQATERGIIYCATRAQAETWYQYLASLPSKLGVTVGLYHGRLPAQNRRDSIKLFQQRQINCMVATTAFGMGIDLPDIRYVLHAQAPGSFEQYIQEIGRAGRDGQPSHCICLAHTDDFEIHLQFAANSRQRRRMLQQLTALISYITSRQCRQHQIQSYFSLQKLARLKCMTCDTCLHQAANLKSWLQPSEQKQLMTRAETLQRRCHTHKLHLTSEQYLWLAMVQPSTLDEIKSVPGISQKLAQRLLSTQLEI